MNHVSTAATAVLPDPMKQSSTVGERKASIAGGGMGIVPLALRHIPLETALSAGDLPAIDIQVARIDIGQRPIAGSRLSV